MTLSLANVTFDCDDPKGLATWWADAIGSQISSDYGEFVTVDGTPIGVRSLAFGKVPEGKAVKNRVHIDLHADDRLAEVARLIERGASHVSDHEVPGLSWTVLLDPAGNEFCVAGR